MRKVRCVGAGIAAFIVASTLAVLAQDRSIEDNIDHAGIISRWDQQSLARGQKIFQIACAPCHGANGSQTINPQARRFAVEKFQNGSDPYSIFKTVTRGFKNMPSQTWMTPEQRYDVVQYVREAFAVQDAKPFPDTLPSIKPIWDSLPKFNAAPGKGANCDKGKESATSAPALESQLGTNFGDVLTFRLNNDVSVSYDIHRMCLAGAWQGGFLDLSHTGHSEQRGEGQPMPKGKPLQGLQKWYWSSDGRFDQPTKGILPRGPLPSAWMKYFGHYVYNRQAVLSYSIDRRRVLELPSRRRQRLGHSVTHIENRARFRTDEVVCRTGGTRQCSN